MLFVTRRIQFLLQTKNGGFVGSGRSAFPFRIREATFLPQIGAGIHKCNKRGNLRNEGKNRGKLVIGA